MPRKIQKTEEGWKKTLSPEQYKILRGKGTEPAFTGQYWDEHRPGLYLCAACGAALFSSNTKFDSGSGWPSFYAPVDKDALETAPDASYGLKRTEAACARCGGHLGHVFDDGPQPTEKRFCINSAALKLKKS